MQTSPSNARLLRVALFVVAGCFLAYSAVQFVETMLFRHVLDAPRGGSRAITKLPIFVDAFLEIVLVGALGAAAAATWAARGPARFLFLIAAAAQALNTGTDVVVSLSDAKPAPGIDWTRFSVYALSAIVGRISLAWGIHDGVRSSGRDSPIAIPSITTSFVVLGQIVSVLRLTVLSDDRSSPPNLLWYQANTIGFGMLATSALSAAFALSIAPSGDAWIVASRAFASLRSLAIARLVVALGFNALFRLCLATKSFGGAYWLTALVQPLTMALGFWGLAGVAAASTIPRARVVAVLSGALFLASTGIDEIASTRLGEFLNSARRSASFGSSDTYFLEAMPSLALGAGFLQIGATALLFKTLAEAAYDRGLAEARSDAHRGMWMSIVASSLSTILVAGMAGTNPWFGTFVLLALALPLLILAIMSFTAFLRATQQLSIAIPRD